MTFGGDDMKVFTCTGFYGTGSSAITDIFSDCEGVECRGEYEIRILHDPYGVSDLEYNLVENPNRHNTSNAIKKFKWNVDFLSGSWWNRRYEDYFNGHFKELSYEYIDNICEFKYYGKWHFDIVERGYWFWFVNRLYNKFFAVVKRIFHRQNDVNHNLLPKDEMAYAGTNNEEKFIKYTKEYTSKLLKSISKSDSDILFVDQLVPPNNFKRYSRYVDNLKIVVVDRDPRDLFVLEKMIWKGNIIPTYDVEVFCKWFLWTRKMFQDSEMTENVIKIQFEDLIYKYDETLDCLLKFADIDKHKYKKNKFDPNVSIKNTHIWENYPELKQEIAYIEKQLFDYCYAGYKE